MTIDTLIILSQSTSLQELVQSRSVRPKDIAHRLLPLSQPGQCIAQLGIPLILANRLSELDGCNGMLRELVDGKSGRGAKDYTMGAECFDRGGDWV